MTHVSDLLDEVKTRLHNVGWKFIFLELIELVCQISNLVEVVSLHQMVLMDVLVIHVVQLALELYFNLSYDSLSIVQLLSELIYFSSVPFGWLVAAQAVEWWL